MPDKKTHTKPKNIQAFYYVLIFVAGGLMMWEKSKPDEEVRMWWLMLWFAVMIFAFFKATKNWAHDNPKPTLEELLQEAEKKENPPEIKDVDIPDLSKMTDNLKNKTEE